MSDPGSTPPPPTSPPPPGWYPDPTGQPRWWTGTMWAAPPPPTDPMGMSPYGYPGGQGYDRSLATLVHVIAIFSGFLGPLIVYFVAKDRDPFARHHAAEALNFSITLLIGYVVCFVLVFVLIGIVLLPLLWIGSVVLHVMAATAANRGEWYRYPVSLHIVS